MAVDAALNAARRLTYGPTPQLLQDIRSKGVSPWLEQQLNPDSILDVEMDLVTSQYLQAAMPPVLIVDTDYSESPVTQQRSVIALRQLASNRQLFEMMAEFWANHFSIDGSRYDLWPYRAWDDQTVARKYALGTFPQLLNASAHSPAMLTFLNNAESYGSNPNENYGRELMELHTVGVGAGYTEDDVHHAALALTGWTIDPTTCAFKFEPSYHYVGPLRVMGWSHPNAHGAGEAVGQSLLNYLATHPSTASHLAVKLCHRFVSDTPSGALEGQVAQSLRNSGMSIPAAIRTIVASKEFLSSDGGKYRRPNEWLMAALRAVGATPEFSALPGDFHPILGALSSLGQVPFGWSPPNGYPDVASAWESTAQTVIRWNLAEAISNNGIGGLTAFNPQTIIGKVMPKTVGDLVDHVSTRLLGRSPGIDERAALVAFCGKPAGTAITKSFADAVIHDLIGMVLSTPTMQVR